MLDFNLALPMSAHEVPVSEDKDAIKDELNRRARAFVHSILPRAIFSGTEARVGNVDGEPGTSLSICVKGADTGAWHDHATGEGGGDFLSLYQAALNCDFKTALSECRSYVGFNAHTPRAQLVIQESLTRHKDKPDLPRDGTKTLEASYEYRRKDGTLNATVYRYRTLDGEKTFRMKQPDGTWKAPKVRTLYRLEEIHDKGRVVIVEGEKCVDALASVGIEACTQMGGANAGIELTDWTPLAGKDCILWPDNDAPGRKFMESLSLHLTGLGCRVRMVKIPPDRPEKWDAADCLHEGGNAHQLIGVAKEADGPAPMRFPVFDIPDAATIPRRNWLCGNVYLGGTVTGTAAPGGAGKSTLTLSEAMCMAAGREALGLWVKGKLRTAIWNLEESDHELALRTAAIAKNLGITNADIGDRLSVVSGMEMGLKIAEMDGGTVVVCEDAKRLEDAIRRQKIDVFIVDPFVSTHGVSENDNGAIDVAVKAFSRIAQRTGCCVHLVHHTGKMRGEEITVDHIRGASSFVGALRLARGVAPMSQREAEGAGLTEINGIVKTVDLKANYSPPSDKMKWYRIHGQEISNGENVGVMSEWKYPDAFDDITTQDVRDVMDALMQDGPHWKSEQANGWAGEAIGGVLGLDHLEPCDRAKIKKLLRAWEASGLLISEDIEDTTRRGGARKRPAYSVNMERMP